MKKRMIAALLAFILIFSTATVVYTPRVYAYQNSSYYNKIRIGLKSMAAPTLNITPNGDYSFNGQALPSGSVCTLTVQSGKVLFGGVQYDSVLLTPQAKDSTLTMDTGSKRYKYLGNMLFKVNSTNIFAINTLNIEDYLKGVVGLEMSDYFPLDALKAQAVAARNYTLANLGMYNASGYDLTDTIDCQVYGGYNEVYKNVLRAVEETKGQVQLYGDTLVQAFYSASNGGYTEAVENVWYSALPYLKAKADSFDSEIWTSPVTFTNAQISSTLKAKGYIAAADTFVMLDLTGITRFASGRAASIDIVYKDSTGLEKRKSVTKDKTRTFLTLPSSLYNVSYDSVLGKYTFSGKGNGHAIGLSQIGAKNRALGGQKYDNILSFYYDGSYLQSIIPKLDSFTIDRDSTMVNQAVSMSASAKYGSGTGYLYKFVVSRDNVPLYTRDYSDSSALSYTPTAAGSYSVTIYAKDKLSESDYDDKTSAAFTAYSLPRITEVNVSGTLYENRTVGINAQTSGGSPSGVGYRFELYKDGSMLDSGSFGTASSYSFVPSGCGSYTVKTYVKDSISTNAYDNMLETPVTIMPEPKLDSFSLSKPSTLQGQAADFAAVSKGGSGTGYLYKYQIIKDGVIVYSTEFSSEPTLSYIPTDTGTYTVSVYMRDNLTDRAYDATMSADFSSYAVPKISGINITGRLYEKRSVTASAIISGGSTAGVSYRFELYKDGVFTEAKDYSASPDYSFTPPAYGSYSVKTFIRDGITTELYDDTIDTALTIQREPVVVSKLPIYWGMKGPDVVQIQTGLTNLGYSLGTIDGIFGSKTYNAVIAFQKSKGLTANGTVDKATLDAMNDALINK